MRLKPTLLVTCMSLAGALVAAGAQAQTASPLSGKVSSAEEGLMEGVLVSAKKEGSTITQTVVTNEKGEFSFPAGKLDAGKYNITIRAGGYTLVGPRAVDVTASGASADIKVAKAQNLVNMISNAEWLNSVPGSVQQKEFLNGCTGCHSLQRIFTSPHTPEEWQNTFRRMGTYAPESTPVHPQKLVEGGSRSERPRVADNLMKPASEFLASVNWNNPDRPEYELKTLPRPKGKATKVFITEYDLPRKEALPHDVIVDADGHAWYSDFGNQFVGELDPKTGKVNDYALPTLRPDQPKGPLNIELDPDGNLWAGLSYQGGAVKIDRKSKQITTYPLNAEWLDINTQTNMVTPTHMNVDGKVWMTDTATRNLYRLDLKTGKWENLGVSHVADRQISGYGLPSDKDNNVYMMEFGNANIGKRDAKTLETKIWQTPIQRSRPRRGRFDDQGKLWFAEYQGQAIGMFDPQTERIKEWKLPTPWAYPYDAVPSKGGAEVWTGSMSNDHVTRLNTKTEEMTEYLLPNRTNIRRVFLEETGPRPVLWVGNNHGSAIIRVEPLD
jgi:streptogramin lyase